MPSQATHIILAPWFVQMSQTDYELKGMVNMSGLIATLWRDPDTMDSVVVYEYLSQLTVLIVQGDS